MVLKILIVDDNKGYAKQLEFRLRNSNFDPHVEYTCKSGLKYFEENKKEIAAILLDVNFDDEGERKGLELLKKIKNIRNTWVGLISQTFETNNSADTLGADAFYSKTITDIERLTDALLMLKEGRSIPKTNNMCELRLTDNQFFLNNKLLRLKGKAFKLLKYLYFETTTKKPKSSWEIAEDPKLMTKYNLSINEGSVRVQVINIRKALPDECKEIVVKTEHSKGYSCPFPKEKNKD